MQSGVCALHKRGPRSESTLLHVVARGDACEDLLFPPLPQRAQVHTAPGGLYLCPCGFLTSGLSKVRTRLLPLNERETFHSRARTRFTWIPRRGSKPDHNGTRVTGFAGHRSHFVRLHLGNSRDSRLRRTCESPRSHSIGDRSESVRVRIEAGYVA